MRVKLRKKEIKKVGTVKLYKRVMKEVGLPPGTLVHVGEAMSAKTRIIVMDYDAANVQEKEIHRIEECLSFSDKTNVTWIRVQGLGDIEVFQKIDTHMGIHTLVLEDILNTQQRPKTEDFEDYMFIVLKVLYYDLNNDIVSSQVSLILGQNFLISFEEKEEYAFTTIRDRIINDKGRVRKMGADYLVYCLIDTIVDNYFVVLEKLGIKIEMLEEDLMVDRGDEISKEVHILKREIIFLRKFIWPLREVINNLQRMESKVMKKATGFFLRDLYDHTIQVMDTIESYRDILTGIHEIDLSNTSKKMNEIIKVLTIITTTFIPISFITGVYGMNFEHMPGLHWKWGYAMVVVMMGVVSLSMVGYFKAKKWW